MEKITLGLFYFEKRDLEIGHFQQDDQRKYWIGGNQFATFKTHNEET